MTVGMNSNPRKEKVPKGYSKGAINNYTPEQEQIFQQSAQQLGPGSYLSRLAGGDQSLYEEMEAPAHRQFNELQGGIASRFSGQGTGGRKNSGFQNTQNQAASNFAQDLQSKRMELRNTAIKDLMGMSDQFLNQRAQEKTLTEKPKSFLHEAGVSFVGGVGKGAGEAAGKWAAGG